jgi:hypothetical protein
MRVVCLAAAFSIFAFLSAAAQSPVASNPQALQILQQSLAALSPNIAVRDVTLSGSAHYIVGSDDETGTAVLKATALGDSRIDLNLNSGPRSEVYNLSASTPTGQWSDQGSTPKPIPYHNLLTEPGWFSPVTAISRRLNGGAFLASYIGVETLDSQSVQHVVVTQLPPTFATTFQLFQHLAQVDLYIDSSTFLPVALSFNTHPDDNELLDLPIEVRYSDYRPVSGEQVPFHIQKFLNNVLILEIQLDSATVNTGLSSTTFSVS